MRRVLCSLFTGTLLLTGVSVGLEAQRPAPTSHWVATWATASVGRPQFPTAAPVGAPAPVVLNFNNQTLGQVVRTSIGGSRARLVVTNEFGTEPLTIGAAHVALRVKDAATDGASDRALSFGGRPTTTIPAGAVIVSDPVNDGSRNRSQDLSNDADRCCD